MNEELIHGRSLVNSARNTEAIAQFEYLIRRHPQAFEPINAYSEAMLREGRVSDLVDTVASFADRNPGHGEAQKLAAAILAIEDKDAAGDFIDRALGLGAATTDCLFTRAETARIAGRPQLHMDSLKAAIEAMDAPADRHLLDYARVCLQYDETERAEAALDLSHPGSETHKWLQATIAAAGDDKDGLVSSLEAWFADPSAGTDLFYLISAMWVEAGDDRLLDLYRRGFDRWIADPDIAAAALDEHFRRPNGACLGNAPVLDGLKVRQSNYLRLVDALIEHGLTTEAKHILDQFQPKSGTHYHQRHVSLEALIGNSPGAADLKRPILANEPGQDVLLSEPGMPGRLVVVFTGLNGKSISGVQTLDRHLAALGYQALYLRDFERVAYVDGVRSLGGSEAATLEALSDVIGKTGAEDPVFIGCSIGAIGAARFGLALGIQRFALFGFQDRDTGFDRWRYGNSRAPILAVRERRHANGRKLSLRDLVEAADHDFQMNIVLGELNIVDSYYAGRIDGLSGVRLTRLKGWASHDTLRPVLSHGWLPRFM